MDLSLDERARRKLLRYRARVRHHFSQQASGPIYVFHHIPKTGGSSVDGVLPCWFYRIRDRRPRKDPQDWNAGHTALPPLDLSLIHAYDCISGHWPVPGEYIHERYPEFLYDQRYRLFAFVRDPLQLKLSLYFWEYRQGKRIEGVPIEAALLSRPNFLAERFPCSEKNYEQVLSRYFFIGITDQLQLSFDRLAEMVSRPKLRLPHSNRSRSSSDRVDLSASFLSEFREVNRLDYLIYDRCLRMLDSRHGCDLAAGISS